jgi:hypothetical protein
MEEIRFLSAFRFELHDTCRGTFPSRAGGGRNPSTLTGPGSRKIFLVNP